MGDDWRDVEAGLDERGHFVPRFVHLAPVDSFDGELVENDQVPIDRSAAGHDSEECDFTAVKHVRQNVGESFWAAGHFKRDVESFFHVEFLHRVGEFFRAHIERESGPHFAGKIETVRINICDDDVTRAGSFADWDGHAADRAGAGDEDIFANEIE